MKRRAKRSKRSKGSKGSKRKRRTRRTKRHRSRGKYRSAESVVDVQTCFKIAEAVDNIEGALRDDETLVAIGNSMAFVKYIGINKPVHVFPLSGIGRMGADSSSNRLEPMEALTNRIRNGLTPHHKLVFTDYVMSGQTLLTFIEHFRRAFPDYKHDVVVLVPVNTTQPLDTTLCHQLRELGVEIRTVVVDDDLLDSFANMKSRIAQTYNPVRHPHPVGSVDCISTVLSGIRDKMRDAGEWDLEDEP